MLAAEPIPAISSGGYLESAKKTALCGIKKTVASVQKYFAVGAKKKAHDLLLDAYRSHVRHASRAAKDGFHDVLMGPFDAVLALIRERHPSVDDGMSKFAPLAESPV